MKLISYVFRGRAGFAAVVEGGAIDLTGRLDPAVTTLKGMLVAGLSDRARAYLAGRPAEFALSDVALLPVIPDPAKIFCIGINYEEHKAETRRPDVSHPTVFTRFADTQVGHRQPLVKPAASDRFDFEGEMAVIIGRGGRHVAEPDALSHVAGYACYNDGSVRDFQRHTSQFTPGKNFPATGGFGPMMVTAEEVGDHTLLPIETRLNGEVMQRARLSDLIFPVPRLIAYVSSFTRLEPGDVIVTGTPGGVGDRREPPVYMRPGDVVEVAIGGLGTLVNPVVAEQRD